MHGDISIFTDYEMFKTILIFLMNEGLLLARKMQWNTLFLRPEAYGIEVDRVFRDKRNKYGYFLNC